MTPAEFSRPLRLDTIGSQPRDIHIEADEAERMALRRRFALVSLDRLEAQLSVVRVGGDVIASGSMIAEAMQTCVATAAPVPALIEESFEIVFRPDQGGRGEEEVELGEAELDVMFYEGAAIDVGEAVAQTLALALDPFPRAANASEALSEAGVKGESEAGPFGGLAALRDKLGK